MLLQEAEKAEELARTTPFLAADGPEANVAAAAAAGTTTHRLLFDNGDELDLTKSNLISAARPKPVNQTPKPGNSRNG